MLVAAFALLFPYNEIVAENVAQGVKVVVIDAGHGGSRYPGASYGGYAEKDIKKRFFTKDRMSLLEVTGL